MELAATIGGEIICADSRTIYKGMDIGTAKPSPAEQALVPHHMLDIVAPDEPYSAADFKRDATTKIKEIRARGHVPIMVGGTGLYVDAVVFDYNFRTKYNQQISSHLQKMPLAELRALASSEGFTTLTNSSNRRHLMRVLEFGDLQSDDRSQMIDNVVIIGLKISRTELRRRLTVRVEQMFKRGLRKEVEGLAKKYSWEHESLTGIGYREFESFYMDAISMSKVKRSIIQHSLNYAKRQRTWFKRNPAVVWFDRGDEAKRYILDQLDRV
jgi:tRNA dimethylallyltransferase